MELYWPQHPKTPQYIEAYKMAQKEITSAIPYGYHNSHLLDHLDLKK